MRQPPSLNSVHPNSIMFSLDPRYIAANWSKIIYLILQISSLRDNSGKSPQSLQKWEQWSGKGYLAKSQIILALLNNLQNLSKYQFLTPICWYLATNSMTKGELQVIVESQDYRKFRTLRERSSSCLRRAAISLKMFWLLMGNRCSSVQTAVNWEMSIREMRIALQRSFNFYDWTNQRFTFASSTVSQLRSSLICLQSLGSKLSGLGLEERISFSAFYTSLYPLYSEDVSLNSLAPAGPQPSNLKYSFLLICVPGLQSRHFS